MSGQRRLISCLSYGLFSAILKMNTIKTIKEHWKLFSTSVCKRSCSLNKNEGDDPIESKRHSFFDSDKKNLGSGPAVQTNNWSANNF